MGITTNDFFENIYSVIFSPKAFFEKENIKISSRLAVFTVIFISTLGCTARLIFDGKFDNAWVITQIIFSILGTLTIWFLTALFFEYIAKVFDRGGNLPKILFYTAFVPVPYIFFSPLNLIKNLGDIGYLIAVLFEFFLYLWIICLYALALRATYKLTLSRSFMLIFLPYIASFFAIYWLMGFIRKIWYIFSI